MDLNEEKKLVVEKLMGWEKGDYKGGGWPIEYYDDEYHKIGIMLKNWNPQDNEIGRRWWDEIWEKMQNLALRGGYVAELEKHFGINMMKRYSCNSVLAIHTAKPAICWKALIKTINQKNQNETHQR